VDQFAYLLTRMQGKLEADGKSMLHHSLCFFSSEIEDGDTHEHSNLPVLVAGAAGGAFSPGRHVKMGETPIANLYLSMLQAAGVPASSFGDSTGPLDAVRV
jgi:hypothetical protein